MVQWAGPVLALVLTPILTRILNPADYGIAELVLTVNSAIGIVGLFALPQALTVHYNDRQGAGWQRQLTGSVLALTLVLAAVIGLILYALAPAIAGYILGNQTYTLLFRLLGATAPLGVLGTVLVTASQAALRVRWGMIFSVTTVICTAAGNLLFIVALRLGAMGLLLTPIVVGIVLSIVSLSIANSLIGRPRWPLVVMLLRSGAWLLPVTTSTWILQMVDRLFLAKHVSPTELGYYAIAYKIAGLSYIVLSPLFSAWTPLALSMQGDPLAKERYADMSRYFVGLALMVVMGLSLFSTEILLVLTRPAYLPAAPYASVLSYVQVLSGIGVLLAAGALISKQLKALSGLVVAGAIVNIVLNFLLIPPYGVWGATIATLVGVAVPQVLLYLWLQQRYPIPYPIGRLLGALGIQIVLVLIALLLPPLSWPFRIAVKSMLMLLLSVSFLALGIITPFELKQAGLFVRHRLRLLGLSV